MPADTTGNPYPEDLWEGEYHLRTEWEQAVIAGYTETAATWDDADSDDDDREEVARMVYREPPQRMWEWIIQQRLSNWYGPDAYLSGYLRGMKQALGERNADAWLSAHTGYTGS